MDDSRQTSRDAANLKQHIDQASEPAVAGLRGVGDHYSIQPVIVSGRDTQSFPLGWIVITAEPQPL